MEQRKKKKWNKARNKRGQEMKVVMHKISEKSRKIVAKNTQHKIKIC